MITSFLTSISVDIVQSIGSAASGIIIRTLKDWPTNIVDSKAYYETVKNALDKDLNELDQRLTRILKYLMDTENYDDHDRFSSSKNRIDQLKLMIKKSGTDEVSSNVTEHDLYNGISIIYATLQLEAYVASSKAIKMYEDLQLNKQVQGLYGEFLTLLKNMEKTWELRSKVSVDPAIAKTVIEELKSTRLEWLKLIKAEAQSTHGEVKNLMTSKVMKKPRLFGKGKFTNNLADFILEYAKTNFIDKISLTDFLSDIRTNQPDMKFSLDDLEKSIKLLIQGNRAFSLQLDDNIKTIEFNRNDTSRVCTNCNKGGGIFNKYLLCSEENKIICDDCIGRFGKCKICNNKVSNNHKYL